MVRLILVTAEAPDALDAISLTCLLQFKSEVLHFSPKHPEPEITVGPNVGSIVSMMSV